MYKEDIMSTLCCSGEQQEEGKSDTRRSAEHHAFHVDLLGGLPSLL